MAEYTAFFEKQMEMRRESTPGYEPMPGTLERSYALYNAICGGEEGFTLDQYQACQGQTLKVIQTIMAAQKAAEQQ